MLERIIERPITTNSVAINEEGLYLALSGNGSFSMNRNIATRLEVIFREWTLFKAIFDSYDSANTHILNHISLPLLIWYKQVLDGLYEPFTHLSNLDQEILFPIRFYPKTQPFFSKTTRLCLHWPPLWQRQTPGIALAFCCISYDSRVKKYRIRFESYKRAKRIFPAEWAKEDSLLRSLS